MRPTSCTRRCTSLSSGVCCYPHTHTHTYTYTQTHTYTHAAGVMDDGVEFVSTVQDLHLYVAYNDATPDIWSGRPPSYLIVFHPSRTHMERRQSRKNTHSTHMTPTHTVAVSQVHDRRGGVGLAGADADGALRHVLHPPVHGDYPLGFNYPVM